MNSFVKVSNQVFAYFLTPKVLFVYTYLLSRANFLNYATVKLEKIASACNMDIKTVGSAIKELENKCIVRKHNRFNCEGYITNKYYINRLNQKRWFKLDRRVFKTNIKSTDFMVYCYIISKMSEKDMQAYPSLSNIVNTTKISRGRVSTAIQYLKQYTFLNRIKRHYKRTKAYRHNRYIHYKCNTRKNGRKKSMTKSTFSFLKLGGITQIPKQFRYPQVLLNKRINILLI